MIAIASTPSLAFELATHGLITFEAYRRSILASASVLPRDLGLAYAIADPETVDQPLGSTYYDFVGMDARVRIVNGKGSNGIAFDPTPMPDTALFSRQDDNRKFAGWLMRGAIREDDDLNPTEPNPKDDPYGDFHRVFNHFFDPITRKGLNIAGLPVPGEGAPAWALGLADSTFYSTPAEPDTARRNHFSVLDAREAMYRALTGKSKEGQLTGQDESNRKRYWATTFRALGDVIHLMQDMAQPQHTRNEPHAGVSVVGVQPFGHKSVFEAYLEARARGDGAFDYAKGPSNTVTMKIVGGRPLPTDGYPIPRFNKYSDYFTTTPQANDVKQGVGLADYSNRGFFTAVKNLGNTAYASPNPNPSGYRTASVVPVGWDGAALGTKDLVTVFLGDVTDTFDAAGTATNVPVSTQSIWDQFLKQRGSFAPSLNWLTYDAAAQLLIPRAVAYSAGILDYFFRGRMAISLPDEGVYAVADHATEYVGGAKGFQRVKLKLQNTTSTIAPSAGPDRGRSLPQDMQGELTAVVKYHKNICYRSDLKGELGSPDLRESLGDLEFEPPDRSPGACRDAPETIQVSRTLGNVAMTAAAPPTALTFEFDTPIPFDALDVYLQVVFRGTLGSEADAVVVATKDVSEPTYFTLVNITDYLFCYNNQWYYRNADGTLPSAVAQALGADPPQLRQRPISSARFAFGAHATMVAGTSLARPLVTVSDLRPGEFARFAVLTESDVVFNDDVIGFYPSSPPPYKLHYAAANQITVLGSGSPSDPYVLRRDWAPLAKFRNLYVEQLTTPYLWTGNGDCLIRPAPPPPADSTQAIPPAPPYPFVPGIKAVSIAFN